VCVELAVGAKERQSPGCKSKERAFLIDKNCELKRVVMNITKPWGGSRMRSTWTRQEVKLGNAAKQADKEALVRVGNVQFRAIDALLWT